MSSGFHRRRIELIGIAIGSRGDSHIRTYRAFSPVRGDEVVDAQCFEAADNCAAEVKAKKFCRDQPGISVVEIWDRGWRLCRHLCDASRYPAQQSFS